VLAHLENDPNKTAVAMQVADRRIDTLSLNHLYQTHLNFTFICQTLKRGNDDEQHQH
jgi:hypothetical protein